MKLFGTDGIRGVVNEDLSPEIIYSTGYGAAKVLGEIGSKAVVAMDTRLSSPFVSSLISSGIMAYGMNVIDLGVVPTAVVANAVLENKAAFGVMISASHNPYEYNGIKLFGSDGYKLPDSTEKQIEQIIRSNSIEPIAKNDKIGRFINGNATIDNYKKHLIDLILDECGDFKGLNIAIDCANGSAYQIAPEVIAKMGANVQVIGNIPDGVNINRNVGSTYLQAISNFVKVTQADIGLSFDGDADRLLVVDENGDFIDGDAIMLTLAIELAKQDRLRDGVIVATQMSNMGLEIAAKSKGYRLIRTDVGDRYVLEEMRKHNYSIGGEQSGHIVLADHGTTGDGIVTAVLLLAAFMKSRKRGAMKSSQLFATFKKLPQVLLNARVPNMEKYNITSNPIIKKEIERLESKYDGNGRVLIRPSGTEPLLRVMLEGIDTETIRADAEFLVEFIEQNY